MQFSLTTRSEASSNSNPSGRENNHFKQNPVALGSVLETKICKVGIDKEFDEFEKLTRRTSSSEQKFPKTDRQVKFVIGDSSSEMNKRAKKHNDLVVRVLDIEDIASFTHVANMYKKVTPERRIRIARDQKKKDNKTSIRYAREEKITQQMNDDRDRGFDNLFKLSFDPISPISIGLDEFYQNCYSMCEPIKEMCTFLVGCAHCDLAEMDAPLGFMKFDEDEILEDAFHYLTDNMIANTWPCFALQVAQDYYLELFKKNVLSDYDIMRKLTFRPGTFLLCDNSDLKLVVYIAEPRPGKLLPQVCSFTMPGILIVRMSHYGFCTHRYYKSSCDACKFATRINVEHGQCPHHEDTRSVFLCTCPLCSIMGCMNCPHKGESEQEFYRHTEPLIMMRVAYEARSYVSMNEQDVRKACTCDQCHIEDVRSFIAFIEKDVTTKASIDIMSFPKNFQQMFGFGKLVEGATRACEEIGETAKEAREAVGAMVSKITSTVTSMNWPKMCLDVALGLTCSSIALYSAGRIFREGITAKYGLLFTAATSILAIRFLDIRSLIEKIRKIFTKNGSKITQEMNGDDLNKMSKAAAMLVGSIVIGSSNKKLEKSISVIGEFPKFSEGISDFSACVIGWIEKLVNWIKTDLYGSKDHVTLLSSGFDTMETWVMEMEKMMKEYDSKGELQKDYRTYQALLRLREQGRHFYASTEKGQVMAKFRDRLNHYMTKLEMLFGPFQAMGMDAVQNRPAPFCIRIYGGTNVGKSTMMEIFRDAMIAETLKESELEAFKRAPTSMCYHWNPSSGYMEGYYGQKWFVVDDAWQNDEVAGEKDSLSGTIIHAMNTAPYSTHMAALEQKGKVFFTSEGIFITTNHKTVHAVAQSINHKDALDRRFSLNLEVIPNEKYKCKVGSDESIDWAKVDYDHTRGHCGCEAQNRLPGSFCDAGSRFVAYKVIKADQCVNLTQPMTFTEALGYVKRKFIEHRLKAETLASSIRERRNDLVEKIQAEKRGLDTTEVDEFTNHIKESEKNAFRFKTQAQLQEEEAREGKKKKPMADLFYDASDRVVDRLMRQTNPSEDVAAWMKATGNVQQMQKEGETEEIPGLTLGKMPPGYVQAGPPGSEEPVPDMTPVWDIYQTYDLPLRWYRMTDTEHKLIYDHAVHKQFPLFGFMEDNKKHLESMSPAFWTVNNLKQIIDNMEDEKEKWRWRESRGYREFIVFKRKVVSWIVSFWEKWKTIFYVAGAILAVGGVVLGLLSVFAGNDEKDKKMSMDDYITRQGGNSDSMNPDRRERPEMSRKARREAARKGLIGNVQQMYDDPTCIDVVATIWKANLYELWRPGAKARDGLVIFVKSKFCVVVLHFIKKYQQLIAQGDLSPDSIMTLRQCSAMNVKFEVPLKQFLDYKCSGDMEKNDLAMVWLQAMPERPDIMKKVIDDAVLEHKTDKHGMIVRVDAMPHILERTLIPYDVISVTTTEGKNITYTNGFEYMVSTQAGDCGSPVFIMDRTSGSKKLAAIHTCGNKITRGFATLITQAELEAVMKEFDKKQPIVQQVRHTFVEHAKLSPNFVVVREIEALPQNTRNDIIPSPLFEKWGESISAPSVLRKVTIDGIPRDPLLDKMLYYSHNQPYIDPIVWKTFAMAQLVQCQEAAPDFKCEGVLPLKEAVYGVPGDKFLKPMTRGTSPGYELGLRMKQLIKKAPGKIAWLGDGPDEPGFDWKHFEEECEFMIEKASRGEVVLSPFLAFPKSERLKKAKVERADTRQIWGASAVLVADWRRYFGSWMRFLQAGRIRNGLAIGVNPLGDEAEMMAKYLNSVGTDFMAGDYPKWDATQRTDVKEACVDAINAWYNDGPKNALIRKTLAQSLYHAYVAIPVEDKDIVFSEDEGEVPRDLIRMLLVETFGITPSGHPDTTCGNSMGENIYKRYGVWDAQNRPPLLESCRYYKENVRNLSQGDDHATGLSKHCAGFFGMKTYQKSLAKIGLGYTDADKNVNIQNEHIPFDKVTFLKRFWRYEEILGRRVCPLDLKTILEMAYWTKDGPAEMQIAKDNFDCAIHYLSMHEQKVWDQWAPRMIDEYQKAFKTAYPWHDRNVVLQQVVHWDDIFQA